MKTNAPVTTRFVICIHNDGYQASLEIGKIYRIVPDEQAQAHGHLRVIDESGEDYVFAANRFHAIELPRDVEKALSAASGK